MANNLENVLTRGVQKILPSKKSLESLMKKKQITLYQGFDPSNPSLHLGNFIGIRKLAQFQKLGHKAIFLIGDFTGMIGDPTDKEAERKKMTKKQVLENAKEWKNQIKNIIDFEGENKAEIKYNSEWLSKLNFEDITNLAGNFTVQQMIERDFFQERIKKEKPIRFHEFLYPLMQGYDSVAMGVDLEIGGNDQLFNMMAGRTLMKQMKNKEKYVLTMKLLTDTTGKKMGKTEGNVINLTESPISMFGKIMALPDSLLKLGIELLTDLPLDTHKTQESMDAKKTMAFEVVKQIHGKEEAEKARSSFESTFQERKPDYEQKIPKEKTLAKTISQISAVGSMSEAKRLIQQGAVDINNKTEYNPTSKIKGGERIKIGKKTFVKVKTS